MGRLYELIRLRLRIIAKNEILNLRVPETKEYFPNFNVEI